MTKKIPSPELLRQLLRYEPETGKLFWRDRSVEMFPDQRSANTWNARFAGSEAFTAVEGKGYRFGSIFGIKYRAHRVIWALETGDWPADQIDHINGERDDNRLVNLREVTNAENGRNRRRPDANTSGVVGVYWSSAREKWLTRIIVDGRHHYLGLFADFDEAVTVRKAAEAAQGYHENHGRASA